MQSIHLIFVGATTDVELVYTHVYGKIQFQAVGFVFAIIVFVGQARRIGGAIENCLSVGIPPVGRVNQGATAAQLQPVAGKLIVVAGGRHPHTVGQIKVVDGAIALVPQAHFIRQGQSVTAFRVVPEIGIGESEVGFIGYFLGILGF